MESAKGRDRAAESYDCWFANSAFSTCEGTSMRAFAISCRHKAFLDEFVRARPFRWQWSARQLSGLQVQSPS